MHLPELTREYLGFKYFSSLFRPSAHYLSFPTPKLHKCFTIFPPFAFSSCCSRVTRLRKKRNYLDPGLLRGGHIGGVVDRGLEARGFSQTGMQAVPGRQGGLCEQWRQGERLRGALHKDREVPGKDRPQPQVAGGAGLAPCLLLCDLDLESKVFLPYLPHGVGVG